MNQSSKNLNNAVGRIEIFESNLEFKRELLKVLKRIAKSLEAIELKQGIDLVRE